MYLITKVHYDNAEGWDSHCGGYSQITFRLNVSANHNIHYDNRRNYENIKQDTALSQAEAFADDVVIRGDVIINSHKAFQNGKSNVSKIKTRTTQYNIRRLDFLCQH